jgi:hypothetical protein
LEESITMDKQLSDYEKLLNEYQRISKRLNSLSIDFDLTDTEKKKLSMTMKKRLNTLLPEIRKKETEV